MNAVQNWNQLPVVLTTEEAADVLRVHTNTILSMAVNDDIPAVKVGRAWRISRDILKQYVEGELLMSERDDEPLSLGDNTLTHEYDGIMFSAKIHPEDPGQALVGAVVDGVGFVAPCVIRHDETEPGDPGSRVRMARVSVKRNHADDLSAYNVVFLGEDELSMDVEHI
jgi:excisionase family DNA binding protein